MRGIFILILLVTIGNCDAQEYRGNYQEWSITFNAGLNKPYHTMTPGYHTSNPNLFHIDLGTRYTITPYIGIKADLGYDAFTNKKNTPKFDSNYIRFDIQAVLDLGYALALYDSPEPFGILFHAGTGVSLLKSEFNSRKDKMVNVIYGFTGTFKISDNISLSGDLSSLIHTRQEITFDGKSLNKQDNLNANLLTSSVGIIYFFRK